MRPWGPQGQAKNPKSGISTIPISSQGFEVTGGVTPIQIRDNEANKYRIWDFFIKETPAQMGCGYFSISCNFVLGCAKRAVVRGSMAEKSLYFDFLHKSQVVVYPDERLFANMQQFVQRHRQSAKKLFCLE